LISTFLFVRNPKNGLDYCGIPDLG
jgi:hypothetical protein